MVALQGYLHSEAEDGGLNAIAAWDDGIHGEGVVLVDGENGWNFNHEDLPIAAGRVIGTPYCQTPGTTPSCNASINHGTGVVGIMGGLGNDHGITGIAYGSDIYALNYTGEDLVYLTDGTGDSTAEEIPPGSVVAIELGVRGALSNLDDMSQRGGLPMEAMPSSFDAIRQATAAGITVVGAAGNGSIDIGRPDAYFSSQVNISENDSSSIIVGGSYGTGRDHRRPPELNCGDRVDVFAWGSGVATTGYPYEGNLFGWTTIPGGANPPNDNPNRHFINNFGGTSAAAAMVAGAAAPGWAYLAFTFKYTGNSFMTGGYYFAYKVPDTLPDAGKIAMLRPDNLRDIMSGRPLLYGGNDCIPMPGHFDESLVAMAAHGIKDGTGIWRISFYDADNPGNSYTTLQNPPPTGIYGGIECLPVVADFDGDGADDRAVVEGMHRSEWRIAYSSNDLFVGQRDADGVRRIPLSWSGYRCALPGRPYSGGPSYEYVREIIEFFQESYPGIPPPIPVDMMTVR